MFKVYIKNYNDSSGNYKTSEKLMFSIPTTNEDGLPVISATVSSSQGAADSFTFTMEANSEYYNSMIQFKTLFRVLYDEDVIFYGRVLTESKSTIYQTKEVRCEGALSFLNDTQYEGIKEDLLTDISITTYFNKIIDNHNNQLGSSSDYSWKKVYKGTVSFNPTSEKRKYEPTSWSDSATLIKNLASNYGGYMKARYSSGKVYIDWYRYYYRDLGSGNRPTIKLGKNLIDFSNTNEVDNIFTRLIPVGGTKKDGSVIYVNGYTYTDKNGDTHNHKTKYIPVSLMTSLYTNSQLDIGFHNHSDYTNCESDYTPVYKTQSFPNADTQEKLWNYSIDFIKNNYYKAASSYSIKAIDMRILDAENVATENRSPKILLGDIVDITYPIYKNGEGSTEKRSLICKDVQYDILYPDKNSYTFGVPTETLDHEYGVKAKEPKKSNSASQATSTASGGGGGGPNVDDEGPLTFDKVARMIGSQNNPPYSGTAAYDSFIANGPMSGTVLVYDPQYSPINVALHPEKWHKAVIIGKTTKYGVGFIQGYAIFAYVFDEKTPKKIAHFYKRYKEGDTTTYDDGLNPITSVMTYVTQGLQNGVNAVLPTISAVISGLGSTLNVGELINSSGKPTGEYNVKLNDTVTYTDANGVTRKKNGFVTAVDIKTTDFPSLSVGILTAKNIAVESLDAARAVITDLTTDTANARSLYARDITCSGINLRGYGAQLNAGLTGSVKALHFYRLGNNADLSTCFLGARVYYTADRHGHLVLERANGEDVDITIS